MRKSTPMKSQLSGERATEARQALLATRKAPVPKRRKGEPRTRYQQPTYDLRETLLNLWKGERNG